MSEMDSRVITLKASTNEGGAVETLTVAAEGAVEVQGAPTHGTLYELDVTVDAADSGDTLNVFVQGSMDGTTNWFDIVAFPQHAGDGTPVAYFEQVCHDLGEADGFLESGALTAGTQRNVWAPFQRVRFTIGDSGANSSFTFRVRALRF